MVHSGKQMLTSDARINAIFRALADPTRRRIVTALAAAPQPVHTLAGRFAVSRPAVSQHISVLRQAGIVAARPRGRENLYYLRTTALRDVEEWLSIIWADRLAGLKALIEGEEK